MNKLLKSIKYVADNSDYVKIDGTAIDKYVAHFEPAQTDHWMKACPFEYHALANVEDEIARWFLEDALAFCFWGYPEKWTVEYQDKKIDGWWALLACFQRSLENNIRVTDGHYLENLSIEQAHELFEGSPQIPLFDERLEALHNIGRTLVTKYDGHFINYMKTAPNHSIQRVVDIAATFPIFDDVSIYKGEKVYFYKKAQLLVHDMAIGFANTPYGQVKGMDKLTGEADYKIPALLRKLGILVYTQELADKVDARAPLSADSAEEVEIRANMLYACHKICEELSRKKIDIDATTLDGMLWVQSQKKSTHDKPYHITLTTDY